MARTPTQALASLQLGQSVVDWAISKRTSDSRPSFRAIATELRDLTGVDVTDETIRLWCSNPEQAAS